MKKEMIIYKGIEFHKIPNIEGYYVSKCGKIYSNKRGGRIMKPKVNRGGYEQLTMYFNGIKRYMTIHKLVGITFLGLEIDNNLYSVSELQVNHINEIKTDNRIENLEIVTPRENQLHSSKSELGIKGVYIDNRSKTNPFKSQITINKKIIYLGPYPTKEIAGRIYQIAMQNIHLYKGNNKEFRGLIQNMYEIEKEYI